MNELRIALRNCHGIGSLRKRITFANNKRHLAIYASNGSMKSSLARTFKDVSKGLDPHDHIYPDRPHSCSITDGNKNDIKPDAILVVDPYDNVRITADMSLDILVSSDRRDEYARASARIRENREVLLKMLHEQSGIPRSRGSPGEEIEGVLLSDMGVDPKPGVDIHDALDNLRRPSQHVLDVLSSTEYHTLFNAQTAPIWGDAEVMKQIGMYFDRYVQLLDESPYLSRDFDHTGAATIEKSLATHGYFKAGHSLRMRRMDGKGQTEVVGTAHFKQVIKDEMERIEEGLRDRWNAVNRILSANKASRDLRRYLEAHKPVVPMLHDVPSLKRSLWECYLAGAPDLVSSALHDRRRAREDILEIARAAEAEQTIWEYVVEVFNRRFDVPFEVLVTNKPQAVMGASPPKLAFTFCDGRGDGARTIGQDDLYGLLSIGEKRAFFLLNILFEVEKRRRNGQETVMLLDDIADSFDYRNKHAIIEYLRDISAYDNFHLIILTHNYDFFRAVNMRGVVGGAKRCLFGARDKGGRVTLKRNPQFDDPLGRITSDPPSIRMLASAMPLARNIAEYTLRKANKPYEILSEALHWRASTAVITLSEVATVIKEVLPRSRYDAMSNPPPETKLFTAITDEADTIVGADSEMDLYDKITLSIATRLHAEKFICSEMFNAGFPPERDRLTTHDLVEFYKGCAQDDEVPAPPADAAIAARISTLDRVALMTPEIIHINSFMYEPILDMSGQHLVELYREVRKLGGEADGA